MTIIHRLKTIRVRLRAAWKCLSLAEFVFVGMKYDDIRDDETMVDYHKHAMSRPSSKIGIISHHVDLILSYKNEEPQNPNPETEKGHH